MLAWASWLSPILIHNKPTKVFPSAIMILMYIILSLTICISFGLPISPLDTVHSLVPRLTFYNSNDNTPEDVDKPFIYSESIFPSMSELYIPFIDPDLIASSSTSHLQPSNNRHNISNRVNMASSIRISVLDTGIMPYNENEVSTLIDWTFNKMMNDTIYDDGDTYSSDGTEETVYKNVESIGSHGAQVVAVLRSSHPLCPGLTRANIAVHKVFTNDTQSSSRILSASLRSLVRNPLFSSPSPPSNQSAQPPFYLPPRYTYPHIVNISQGGPNIIDSDVNSAIIHVISQGSLVIVSAGNEGPVGGTITSPANLSDVITVGSAVLLPPDQYINNNTHTTGDGKHKKGIDYISNSINKIYPSSNNNTNTTDNINDIHDNTYMIKMNYTLSSVQGKDIIQRYSHHMSPSPVRHYISSPNGYYHHVRYEIPYYHAWLYKDPAQLPYKGRYTISSFGSRGPTPVPHPYTPGILKPDIIVPGHSLYIESSVLSSFPSSMLSSPPLSPSSSSSSSSSSCQRVSGTSVATPVLSSIIALLMEYASTILRDKYYIETDYKLYYQYTLYTSNPLYNTDSTYNSRTYDDNIQPGSNPQISALTYLPLDKIITPGAWKQLIWSSGDVVPQISFGQVDMGAGMLNIKTIKRNVYNYIRSWGDDRIKQTLLSQSQHDPNKGEIPQTAPLFYHEKSLLHQMFSSFPPHISFFDCHFHSPHCFSPLYYSQMPSLHSLTIAGTRSDYSIISSSFTTLHVEIAPRQSSQSNNTTINDDYLHTLTQNIIHIGINNNSESHFRAQNTGRYTRDLTLSIMLSEDVPYPMRVTGEVLLHIATPITPLYVNSKGINNDDNSQGDNHYDEDMDIHDDEYIDLDNPIDDNDHHYTSGYHQHPQCPTLLSLDPFPLYPPSYVPDDLIYAPIPITTSNTPLFFPSWDSLSDDENNATSSKKPHNRYTTCSHHYHTLVIPIYLMLIPTPPSSLRILFDEYYSASYPEAYIPHDIPLSYHKRFNNTNSNNNTNKNQTTHNYQSNNQSSRPYTTLDQYGDKLMTNYHDIHILLRLRGYYIEPLTRSLSCLDRRLPLYTLDQFMTPWVKNMDIYNLSLQSYGLIIMIDPEVSLTYDDYYTLTYYLTSPSSTLSIIFALNWFGHIESLRSHSLYSSDYITNNHHNTTTTTSITPSTIYNSHHGGSSIHNINMILSQYNINISDIVYKAPLYIDLSPLRFENKSHNIIIQNRNPIKSISLQSSHVLYTTISKWPSAYEGGSLAYASLLDNNNNPNNTPLHPLFPYLPSLVLHPSPVDDDSDINMSLHLPDDIINELSIIYNSISSSHRVAAQTTAQMGGMFSLQDPNFAKSTPKGPPVVGILDIQQYIRSQNRDQNSQSSHSSSNTLSVMTMTSCLESHLHKSQRCHALLLALVDKALSPVTSPPLVPPPHSLPQVPSMLSHSMYFDSSPYLSHQFIQPYIHIAFIQSLYSLLHSPSGMSVHSLLLSDNPLFVTKLLSMQSTLEYTIRHNKSLPDDAIPVIDMHLPHCYHPEPPSLSPSSANITTTTTLLTKDFYRIYKTFLIEIGSIVRSQLISIINNDNNNNQSTYLYQILSFIVHNNHINHSNNPVLSSLYTAIMPVSLYRVLPSDIINDLISIPIYDVIKQYKIDKYLCLSYYNDDGSKNNAFKLSHHNRIDDIKSNTTVDNNTSTSLSSLSQTKNASSASPISARDVTEREAVSQTLPKHIVRKGKQMHYISSYDLLYSRNIEDIDSPISLSDPSLYERSQVSEESSVDAISTSMTHSSPSNRSKTLDTSKQSYLLSNPNSSSLLCECQPIKM